MIGELSVFLPTYNEEGNIKNVVINTKNILESIANEWEIIIVDDGSTDNTNKIAQSLVAIDNRISVITHKTNMGYGAALKSGFYNSKYDWISFIDSDGQFDFSEISNFITKQKETNADLVIGYYQNRRVSVSKKITSKLWEYLVLFLFNLKVRDIDCGFKLISKKVFVKIASLESQRGAFISSELLIKAKKFGFVIAEIPVTHYPRKMGRGTGRNIDVIIQSFRDLFKLYWDLKTYGKN